MQTRERAHCARSVFPFIKKKKKKIMFTISMIPLVRARAEGHLFAGNDQVFDWYFWKGYTLGH